MSAHILLLVVLALLPALQANAALELPFVARLESVIEDGEIEGQAVQVARVSTRLNLDELVGILRREWRGPDGAELVETRFAGWRVLSSWSAQGFRTLQLRAGPTGGSEGVLSVWPSGARRGDGAGIHSGLPGPELLPARSTILRRFSAVDSGRRGQTLVALADGPPAWLADAIGQRLVAKGFGLDRVLHAGGAQGEARRYGRGDVEVVLTVSDAGQGRSGVVLHAIGAAR